MSRKYTDKQKIAYYKKLAAGKPAARPAYKKTYANNNNANARKPGYYSNRFYQNYKKPYKYPGVGRSIGGLLGSAAGGIVGAAPIGNMVGSALGQGAHALIKTITGHGDYTVSQNALIYNKDAVPQFNSDNPRCTTLVHSEFIKDIRGSTTFAIDTFDINASNSALFPWLSQIARNFEQIVWQGLVFQFKTTCATAVSSTNTAMGTVVMATQYDSLSEKFVNKQQMENYEFAQSAIPSQSLMHAIECDPKLTANNGLFYVDTPTNNNSNADPRLYNIGKFNIATVGMQAAATIGELWVSYKVCLMKPRQIGNNNQSDQWILDHATLTDTKPFGDYPFMTSSSTSAQYNAAKEFNPYPSDQSFSVPGINPWNNYAADPNEIYINPAFVGQIVVIYQVNTDGVAACNEPGWSTAGNMTLISDPDLIIGFNSIDINGCAGGFHAVAAFQCNGGYNNSGVAPIIILGGGSYPGGTDNVTQASLAIYAVANNLRDPSLP